MAMVFLYNVMTLPNTKDANAAVSTLLAPSKKAWFRSNFPSGIHPKIIAATAARKPTTNAWVWTRARFPATMIHWSLLESMFPKLAWKKDKEWK